MKIRGISSGARALLGFVFVVGSAGAASAQSEPAALFNARCSSCHTFGKGDKVGPDLKGVATRRPRTWLLSWIRSSGKMVKAADPTAAVLYQKYRRQRMPDFELPAERIAAVVDYLAAGGPETDAERQLRAASTATPEEVRLGQQLFEGRIALASGAVACVSCHTVSSRGALGGSLGPDLAGAFAKYRDRGLHQYLQRVCFPRGPGVNERKALTESESLALRAFLRISDPGKRVPAARAEGIPAARPAR